jgi:ribosomal protein S27E
MQALILSEYGVGGGVHQNGSVPAKTAADAAQFPFFGIWGSYNPAIGKCRDSVLKCFGCKIHTLLFFLPLTLLPVASCGTILISNSDGRFEIESLPC